MNYNVMRDQTKRLIQSEQATFFRQYKKNESSTLKC